MSVKSAERVLDILQMFAEYRRPATLTEVSTALELPKSSCLALLQTLEEKGYLYLVGSEGYYPTSRWLEAARSIARHDPVVRRMRPVLEDLRDRTSETLSLTKRSRAHVLYLDVVDSKQVVRYTAVVGERRALHCSASGQALLGGMDPDERERVIRSLRLDRRTDLTPTNRQALEAKINAGMERGWFSVAGEYDAETAAVAVPVRMYGDVYAVVIAAPRQRLEPALDKMGRLLANTCRGLSDRTKETI